MRVTVLHAHAGDRLLGKQPVVGWTELSCALTHQREVVSQPRLIVR